MESETEEAVPEVPDRELLMAGMDLSQEDDSALRKGKRRARIEFDLAATPNDKIDCVFQWVKERGEDMAVKVSGMYSSKIKILTERINQVVENQNSTLTMLREMDEKMDKLTVAATDRERDAFTKDLDDRAAYEEAIPLETQEEFRDAFRNPDFLFQAKKELEDETIILSSYPTHCLRKFCTPEMVDEPVPLFWKQKSE